jgi:tellurite resistance protein
MSEISSTQMVAMLSSTSSGKRSSSWYEKMADAWGDALNTQATRIVEQADKVAEGFDTPSEITQLTAESLRMNFISNSSHTSLTSVGSALETLARKQ